MGQLLVMKKTINPTTIYHVARCFEKASKMKQQHGRPRQYSLALILTIACIQNLYTLSFREALEFSEFVLKDIPCLSTFHYRVKTLDPEIIQQFIGFLGLELQKQFHEAGKKIKLFIIDGTGFSYHDVYPLQYLRGTEVRKVQSHVRALALVASTGRERFFIGAQPGRAYASETKMAEKLLPHFSFKQHLPFLGDKGFDSIYLLHSIKQAGALPCIKMKEGRHMNILDPERKLSKKNECIHGGKRTLIEGLFGNTKQKTTSHIKVFIQSIAKTFALIRLALYDIYLLSKMLKGYLLFEQPL